MQNILPNLEQLERLVAIHNPLTEEAVGQKFCWAPLQMTNRMPIFWGWWERK